MREIRIFYDNSNYTLTWLRRLIFAEKEFKKAGYKIKFDSSYAYDLTKKRPLKTPSTLEGFVKLFSKSKYDVVFLAYHHSKTGLCSLSPDDRAKVLNHLKKKTDILVWLDTADGAGTCMFDVMPYVDKYLKKQILVDRERYLRPIWSDRIFGEYYHEKFGVEETGKQENIEYPLLDGKYIDKLGISWNVGIGDLYTVGKWRAVCRKRHKKVNFFAPKKDNKYDIQYRGGQYPGAIGFQRKHFKELLSKRNDLKMPDFNTRVPYDEFVEEVKASTALLSPFGWGEICGRDFETFAFGDLLIKPDMSHLETYPNLYIENKTYIPVKWDFSDFNEILDRLISEEGKEKAYAVSVEAQKLYREAYSSEKADKDFVNHIISQIER